jgi:hypothetical protein
MVLEGSGSPNSEHEEHVSFFWPAMRLRQDPLVRFLGFAH